MTRYSFLLGGEFNPVAMELNMIGLDDGDN
jgi:hypothetical protein